MGVDCCIILFRVDDRTVPAKKSGASPRLRRPAAGGFGISRRRPPRCEISLRQQVCVYRQPPRAARCRSLCRRARPFARTRLAWTSRRRELRVWLRELDRKLKGTRRAEYTREPSL